jgi:hypothetical protein
MKATFFPSSIKLQVFAAVILLLFQVNLIAVGLTTAPIPGLKEETNHTEFQDVSTSAQPDLSQPSLLKGIVLTAIIVVSLLGGLSCLIMCTVVTVAISVKIHHRRKQDRTRRGTSAVETTATVNVQSFDMMSNAAYQCGEQVRTSNTNVYSPRPSSRASNVQNAYADHAHSEASVLPNRYRQTPNHPVDISVDSLGYVRLPKPHD